MKTPRVYLDTSVLGGCFDPEFERWSSALIADCARGLAIPVVSQVVAAEVMAAPELVQQKFQEVVLQGAEILEVDGESLEVVAGYARQEILPPRFRNDMLHIALATVAEVDVLVSWNFKHIVRLEKIRRYNAVNLQLGYRSLQIRSPREVVSDEG